ncbi:MAG TPA: FAD binding domain-containing protein [Terriglobia bacterium]|nr:FAD binding domain-containing protein [Terriglobia bacterium]
MATTALTPRTLTELLKLTSKHGKRAAMVSGIDPGDRAPAGKVFIDLTAISALQTITAGKGVITTGTGMNLGRLAREAEGENGLLRHAASLVANPLVRNRVTLVEALDPVSPYFDITTPLVLLDAKVRLQSPTGKRAMAILDYLELAAKGLKKGEIPVAVEFEKVSSSERVGFFRVARERGKGSVSAAAKMKIVRNVCMEPEIVVSSLSLIPQRSTAAEKEIKGKAASEQIIQAAAQQAAAEISAISNGQNVYEQRLIEITVSRTLRDIMEGSIAD